MKRMATSFLTVALLLAGVGQAKADLVLSSLSGTVYENYSPGGRNGSAGGTIADQPTIHGNSSTYATFSTPGGGGVNYQSPNSPYTIGGFLSNATSFSGHHGFSSTDSLANTYIILTGTATFTAGTYLPTFSHDDGAELLLTKGSSTILDYVEGGPTNATQANPRPPITLNGTYNFTLSYYENGSAPADLEFSVKSAIAVPEPATLGMAGLGLVAFGGYKLRRRKPVVA